MDTWPSDIIVRDSLFRNFGTGSDPSGVYWIQINGFHHTVEYCSFIDKYPEDPVIDIIPTEDSSGPATKDQPRQRTRLSQGQTKAGLLSPPMRRIRYVP